MYRGTCELGEITFDEKCLLETCPDLHLTLSCLTLNKFRIDEMSEDILHINALPVTCESVVEFLPNGG